MVPTPVPAAGARPLSAITAFGRLASRLIWRTAHWTGPQRWNDAIALVVGFVMWFVGVGLIWFAIQTIKNPTPGFPIYVQRTWQTILIVLGVVLIVGVFF